ncbi:MAG: aldose epimerase family protein [Armatimonadota bacterium]
MTTIGSERLQPQTISRTGRFSLAATVTPGVGANLISFTVDGVELIYWDEPGFLSGDTFTGAFTMFPTPCRLDNCSYEFEGRKIVQKKHGEEVFIHGLVRDEVMTFRNDGDSVNCWIDITPDHPVYEGFPYRCRFSVSHRLGEDSLTVGFRLENKDTCNIPFGYGIHPFWRLQGDRKNVAVRVPCDSILDLENLVPTGGVTPVAGTELDLQQGKSLDGFFIDNAFWKRNPGDSAQLTLKSIGKAIVYEASDNFPHMIVYAPEGQPFVCVENLTTCPNAPNLVTAGHGDVANMLTAAPGSVVEGWIKYTIKAI